MEINNRIAFILIPLLLILSYAAFIFRNRLLKGHKQWKEKMNANPTNRKSYSKMDFINEYIRKGYSEKAIIFVYDQTQRFLKSKDIVLLSNDHLVELYERQADEWLHIIKKWLKYLNRHVPGDIELSKELQPLNFESIIKVIENQDEQNLSR